MVGHPWTDDQPVALATTCAAQTRLKTRAFSGIQTHYPGTVDLRLRLHSQQTVLYSYVIR